MPIPTEPIPTLSDSDDILFSGYQAWMYDDEDDTEPNISRWKNYFKESKAIGIERANLLTVYDKFEGSLRAARKERC